MENDRLAWDSEYGNSVGVSYVRKPTPAAKLGLKIVLLLSGNDAADCCAKNFERTVFRDQKVVRHAKKYFATIRLERSYGAGNDLYSRFDLESGKPAVLLLDEEDNLLYKTQRCKQPKQVFTAMLQAMGTEKTKLAYSAKIDKRLETTENLIRKNTHEKYGRVCKYLSTIEQQLLVKSVRERAAEQKKTLQVWAVNELKFAKRLEEKKDYDAALQVYRRVEKSFRPYKTVRDYARKAIQRIDDEQRKLADPGRVSATRT